MRELWGSLLFSQLPAAVAAMALATSAEALQVTAGRDSQEFAGSDQECINRAIAHVGSRGGGEVVVQPGEYVLSNSVLLADGVTLRGEGDVVLVKDKGASAPFTSDCGYGYGRVKLADASQWPVGWGVTLKDDRNAGGFNANVRTIAAVEGDDLVLDEDTTQDFCVHRNARIEHSFPLVAGYGCANARIINIICDGNAEENELLDGCRGGAIYLFRSEGCEVRNCTARNFHGDGISFQISPNTLVSRCTSTGNTHLGLHPGSGSHHSEISNCEAYDNGGDGLFLCWRVAHSHFEQNRIHDNAGHGISIGHKDTDNLFLRNIVESNKRHGLYFRNEPDYNAGHRCTFESNVFRNNSGPEGAAIFIDGTTTGTRLYGNVITDDRGKGAAAVGIRVGENASDVEAARNKVSGFAEAVENLSEIGNIRIAP